MLWERILDFPNYLVSNFGHVSNDHTGKMVSQSTTRQGAVKVNLLHNKTWHTKSVPVLVAEAFVPGRDEIFDTPIHLDGHQENNRADNLMWRPRWFAWRYTRQFIDINDIQYKGPLVDQNGVVYRDVFDAATFNGLLFKEVWRSIHFINPVHETFPTGQTFSFVREN